MRASLACRTITPPPGTHRYVSPIGLDSNDGVSGSPWRTIGRAASLATPGTTIHVAPGTYNELVAMSRSGTSSARIRFVSDTRWAARIWPTASTSTHIFRITGSYIDVEGFDMGPAGSNVIVFGVDTTGTANRFAYNRIHDINTSGSATGSAMGVGGLDSVIEANWVYNAGHSQLDHCIYVYTGHGHTLVNNLAGNAGGWCITMWHNAYEVSVLNNTVFNGRRALGSNGGGILIGAGEHPDSDARDCIIANNIAYGSSGDGIAEAGIVHNNIYLNNLLYSNAWSSISLINGTQTGTIISDPNFVGYRADGTGDYRVQPGSLAIDRADPIYAPGTDFDGVHRLIPDIGAYEFQS